MEKQQEGSTVVPGKDGKATGRNDSVTEKRWKGNRKEGQYYWEKIERQQEGRTVLLGKDRKATGSKDSVAGVGWKGNRKEGLRAERWKGKNNKGSVTGIR
jgi:hypothetical protein